MRAILHLIIFSLFCFSGISCNYQGLQKSYFIDEVEVKKGEGDLQLDEEEKKFIKKVANIPIKKLFVIPFHLNPAINKVLKRLAINGYITRLELKNVEEARGKITKILIIVLKKLPLIDYIQWTGVPYADKQLLEKKIPLAVGNYYRESQLRDTSKVLKNYFISKGYLDVFVQTKFKEKYIGRHRISTSVYKGKKYYIEVINFEGNKQVNTLLLNKQIPLYGDETKGYRVLKKSIFFHFKRKEWLELIYSIYAQLRQQQPFLKSSVEESVTLLTNYLRNKKGLLYADVTYRVKVNRKTNKVRITFIIKENELFKVVKINWVGNESFTDKQLNKALRFYPGMIYKVSKINKVLQSKTILKSLYTLYEKKQVFLSDVKVVASNIKKGKVVLTIYIKEIKNPVINAINIKGNLREKIAKGILASNNLEEEKIFRNSNLLFARKELLSSDLINPHKMRIRATQVVKAGSSKRVNIDAYLPISVTNNTYLRLSNFQSIEAEILLTNIDILPILQRMRLPRGGGGMSLGIKLSRDLDKLKRHMPFNLDISVKHPWIFIKNSRFLVIAGYRYNVNPSEKRSLYNSAMWRMKLGHYRNYGPHRGLFSFAISHTKGEKFQSDKKIKTSFTKFETAFKYELTNVNHFFFPTQGYQTSLRLDIALPPGKIRYIRPHLESKWYYPFPSYTLMQNLQLGVNFSQNGIAGNFTLKKDDDAQYQPIYLRGHNKKVTPLFSNGYGGDIYLTYHTEIRKHLFGKNDYISLFANIGLVKQSAYTTNSIAKRWGVGIGFTQRWKLGPISIYLVWTDSIIPTIEFDFSTKNKED